MRGSTIKNVIIIILFFLIHSIAYTQNIAALKDSIQKLNRELDSLKENNYSCQSLLKSKIKTVLSLTTSLSDTMKIINYFKTHDKTEDRELKALMKEDIRDEDSLKHLEKDIQENDSIIVQDKVEEKVMTSTIQRNKKLLMVMGVMLLLSILLGLSIYTNYRDKKKANDLLQEKNEKISAQKEELERHHSKVLEQRNYIAQQNKEITDSIIYAGRIQTALLPHKDTIKPDIAESFILYMPRNIVSGDYYWMSKKDKKVILVAADCTGHGVPGAFMSMLGMAFLNDIISNKGILYANEILNQLREYIIIALKQKGAEEDSKDGMDMAICIIDFGTMIMQYAGAYNPIYHIRSGEIKEIEADRMPVSFYHKGQLSFTNKLISIKENDLIYMFSDGICDQFGGQNNKKFSSHRFRELLLAAHSKPLTEQHQLIEKAINDWKGTYEQTDDILVIGIKV